MRWPSCSVKLRTHPTREEGSPCSMRLCATTACHWSWLLKSRSTSQTRPIGASMIAERTTFCSMSAPAGEMLLQRVEATLEDAGTDPVGEFLLAPLGAVELRAPFGEGALAV